MLEGRAEALDYHDDGKRPNLDRCPTRGYDRGGGRGMFDLL